MPYNRARQDNWWERRTTLERQLSCIAIGMIFFAVILLVTLIYYQQYGVPNGICLTTSCVHAASAILNKLDERISPCEDFYAFACGGFLQKKIIPDDIPAYNSFTEVNEKLMWQLRHVLEEPIKPSDIQAVKIVKMYYSACLNTNYINQEGLSDAQTLLNSLGGWPVLEEAWDSTSFDWIEQLKLFKENGLDFHFLLFISAGKDFGDSTRRIINIDQPLMFGLDTHMLEKGIHDHIVKGYLQLMVDFAVLFGANDFKASEELEDVLNFEMQLAKRTVSKDENRNNSHFYNKMTLKQLNQQYGTINWEKLLNFIFPEAKLYDEKEVLVQVPSYIDGFERILKATKPKTIANYLFWRAVVQMAPFLPQRFEDRLMKFKKMALGISQSPPRWKNCLDLTKEHTRLMLGATYVRKFSNNEIKEYATEIVKDVVTAFEDTIKHETSWMDEKTKNQALDKARALTSNVAYPNELFDDKLLEDMFAGIFVSEKMFLQSFLNLNKHEWNRVLRKLQEPVKQNDWTDTTIPFEVNAFYFRLENSMILPAAILQGPYFNKDNPSYLNYGGIGSIVGHEIVHAFDDQGSQFDEHGNLKNWWEKDTRDAFVEKTHCFIEKFNNIRVDEIKQNLSGTRTLGENIADNGGTKQAYVAYNMWVDDNWEESKLPGLQYTPRQLFWIAGAQNWCSKERIEIIKRKVASDPHAPNKHRVNANYQNLENFAKDFKCPLGSNMNPQKKCSIW